MAPVASAAAAPAAGSAAASPAAVSSPARCVFGGGNPVDCRSSDPEVTKVLYSGSGDCSSTYQKIDIDWGDGTPVQKISTYGPTPNQKLPIGSHDYAKRGTYDVSVTGSVVSGPCTFTATSYTFTLAKVTSKLRLAALGDSYSSGEGSGDYIHSAGACDRSPNAWAMQLDGFVANHDVTMVGKYFLACSGATSPDLIRVYQGQQPQIEVLGGLRPRPTLVTMTMGGNDAGFSTALRDCYLSTCVKCVKGTCTPDKKLQEIAKVIAGLKTTLYQDYVKLTRAAPAATILIVGYPQLFDPKHTCDGFKPEELTRLNDLDTQLNGVIKSAAEQANVRYVPIPDALQGHELCAPDSWLYPISVKHLLSQQQVHPTKPGQRAIAELVGKYINNTL